MQNTCKARKVNLLHMSLGLKLLEILYFLNCKRPLIIIVGLEHLRLLEGRHRKSGSNDESIWHRNLIENYYY